MKSFGSSAIVPVGVGMGPEYGVLLVGADSGIDNGVVPVGILDKPRTAQNKSLKMSTTQLWSHTHLHCGDRRLDRGLYGT